MTGGTLDGSGQAAASINFPALLDPNLVGLKLHHAYFTYDAGGTLRMASNPVTMTFEL